MVSCGFICSSLREFSEYGIYIFMSALFCILVLMVILSAVHINLYTIKFCIYININHYIVVFNLLYKNNMFLYYVYVDIPNM